MSISTSVFIVLCSLGVRAVRKWVQSTIGSRKQPPLTSVRYLIIIIIIIIMVYLQPRGRLLSKAKEC